MTSTLHVKVFIAHNGPGPWSCFFCTNDVMLQEVTVHHIDHDHSNNDPMNLVASHFGCHSRHHATGRTKSERERLRISSTRKSMFSQGKLVTPTQGVGHTLETRAKISASHIGLRPSDEARKKMSASKKGKMSEPSKRGWKTRRMNQAS